jgi:hypothetical protein
MVQRHGCGSWRDQREGGRTGSILVASHLWASQPRLRLGTTFADVLEQLINAPFSLRVERHLLHMKLSSKDVKLLSYKLLNFRKNFLSLGHNADNVARRNRFAI